MSSAGQYNKVITIRKYDTVINDYGEQKIVPKEDIQTRAKILNLSTQRESINNETFYEDTKQVTIHDYIQLHDFDHIIIDDTDYQIVTWTNFPEYRHKIVNIRKIQK